MATEREEELAFHAGRQSDWTAELRKQVLEESERNLFFFATAVCNYPDITEAHRELCEDLDGRGTWGPNWVRAIISCFRGFLKTSIIRAFCAREGLHRVNWSCRYLGAGYDNASLHFLRPIDAMFRTADGAEWRMFLYRHRIPKNFVGWKEDQIAFKRTDANAPPALSIKGASASSEGYHGNLIVIDDPEGAEAEKAGTGEQVDAVRVVSNANPLLINPGVDRIVLVGTVHGDDPVVYRGLYENFDEAEPAPSGNIEFDNSKRVWKQYWQPVYKADGTPAWPERFGKETIHTLQKTTSADTWQKQYLLLRGRVAGGWWKKKTIERNFWSWSIENKVIRYPALKVDMKLWKSEGKLKTDWETREVRMDELFFGIHFDPKHKQHTTSYRKAKIRASQAAVVVVGVAPDFHVFTLDLWAEDASFEQQLDQLFKMHVKYGARWLTSDPIGAQVWLRTILEREERSNPVFSGLRGKNLFGVERNLPRLSRILVEDKRSPSMSKEEVIHARLDDWISTCQIHFRSDQAELVAQAVGLPDDCEFVDLIDALAQGPEVWAPPMGKERYEQVRQSEKLLRQIGQRITNYRSPLAKRPQIGAKIILPESERTRRRKVVA